MHSLLANKSKMRRRIDQLVAARLEAKSQLRMWARAIAGILEDDDFVGYPRRSIEFSDSHLRITGTDSILEAFRIDKGSVDILIATPRTSATV